MHNLYIKINLAMKILKYVISAFFALSFLSASAVDFFSTEPSPKFFTLGARMGINTSNHTFPNGNFNIKNINSWGTGFSAGVVANLNFREYFTLQPGIFYESRSGRYTYASSYITNTNHTDISYQIGHSLFYDLSIPVMAVFNFNIAENVKWKVEAGPYLQINLKKPDNDKIIVLYREPLGNDYKQKYALSHFYDFGLKFGSGISVNRHYYFGIHYLCGLREVWGYPAGGRNKAWTFTLGYDF